MAGSHTVQAYTGRPPCGDTDTDTDDAVTKLLTAVSSSSNDKPSRLEFLQCLCIAHHAIPPTVDPECGICREVFQPGASANFVPVCAASDHHRFCGTCIQLWAAEHNSCPVCRRSLYREATTATYPWASADHLGTPRMHVIDSYNVETLRKMDAYLSAEYGSGYWRTGEYEVKGLLWTLLAQRAKAYCDGEIGELELSWEDFVPTYSYPNRLEVCLPRGPYTVVGKELRWSLVDRFSSALSRTLSTTKRFEDVYVEAHPLAWRAVEILGSALVALDREEMSVAELEASLVQSLGQDTAFNDVAHRASRLWRDKINFPHTWVEEADCRPDALPVGFDIWLMDAIWRVLRNFMGEEMWWTYPDLRAWPKRQQEELTRLIC